MTPALCVLCFAAGGWCVVCAACVLAKAALSLLLRVATGF